MTAVSAHVTLAPTRATVPVRTCVCCQPGQPHTGSPRGNRVLPQMRVTAQQQTPSSRLPTQDGICVTSSAAATPKTQHRTAAPSTRLRVLHSAMQAPVFGRTPCSTQHMAHRLEAGWFMPHTSSAASLQMAPSPRALVPNKPQAHMPWLPQPKPKNHNHNPVGGPPATCHGYAWAVSATGVTQASSHACWYAATHSVGLAPAKRTWQ